ncbi:MAG: GNAT family N-acetyltransferase [Actinomycetota bacterium]
MTALVRPETPEDHEVSVEVERAAFDSDEEASIVEAVRNEEASFALVAEEDDIVVGHVQLSRGWVGDTPVLVLGPIGVLPDRQRRGIGSALMRHGLEEARARREAAVILFGEPGFYRRFGFEPGVTFGVPNPYAGRVLPDGTLVAEENFLLAPLDDRARSLSGEIRMHPALTLPG